MYATVAALVAARVAAKAKKAKERREQHKGEATYNRQNVMGMRLKKENQIMRLARRSLKR